MSDINLDFTVNNNSINFTVEPNQINITPTDMVLTINPNFQPLAGGSPFQLQFNNAGILGGVANSSYTSGNLTLGDVANIKITGGTNGYVLQTDGAGNLDWTAMTGGGGGNGTPGGSNTQIQYNDNGTFGGNAGFTFNEVSGNVAIPGSLAVTGNITGNVQNAYLANYATVANNIAGSNVTGAVNLANYATVANSVAVANVVGLGNIAVINLTGSTSNVLYGNGVFAAVAGATSANFANYAGNVTVAAQANITSVGVLTDLLVNNTKIHLGTSAYTNQGANAVAIGRFAGVTNQGANGVAIGRYAGSNTQAFDAVAIGNSAAETSQGSKAVAIGWRAGSNNQGDNSVAIGLSAGVTQQGIKSIAIGDTAGTQNQGANSIGIGTGAGGDAQGNTAIAIGLSAGLSNQGANSIAIGTDAGAYSLGVEAIAIGHGALSGPTAVNNVIMLNATGANINATQANSLFVKPIRDVTGNASFTVQLYYNPTTGEIGYK